MPLPVSPEAIPAQKTCEVDADARLKLALHYWVKWNLLGDRWVTHSFAVENLTIVNVAGRWCAHCDAAKTCRCPEAARRVVRNATEEKVRARRGHGRKPLTLTWATLERVDRKMAAVAKTMAVWYGYALDHPP